MSKNNSKDQNQKPKGFTDLAGIIAASKGQIHSWEKMSALLNSKNDKGVPTILTFEQALELISNPSKYDHLQFRRERYECARKTFACFHGGVTGFPQALEEKYGYSQFETGEILLNELENKTSRPIVEKKYRYQTIEMVDKLDPKKVNIKTIKHLIK